MMKSFSLLAAATFSTSQLLANCSCGCPMEAPPCKSFWIQPENDIGLTTSADFLYWQANLDGIEYGQIANFFANIAAPPVSSAPYYGSWLYPSFQFTPGTRVNIGFRPHKDRWQVDATWVYLSSNAHGSSHNPNVTGGAVVVPINDISQLLSNNGINAKAMWWADYNALDLDINRGVSFSDAFGIKAHLGLRSLWLDQKYNVYSINLYNTAPDVFTNANAHLTQNIWGMGPLIGLDSLWKLWGGFGLVGKASLSLLWSHIHALSKGYFGTNNALIRKELQTFHTTLPEVNMLIGCQYDTGMCGSYHFSGHIGWEFTTLFSANYLENGYLNPGNFNMSGLTAGLGFDY